MIHPMDPSDQCSVRMEAVSHRYGRVDSVRSVSLEITQGEFVYLVGPSASGKTTLLKLIHGEERSRSGRIWVEGKLVEPRSRSHRRRIGVVFQEYRLLERRTAFENVAFALRVVHLTMDRGELRQRVLTALAECGLEHRHSAYPGELSGGQRQRLAIARALAPRPRLLLADEPTASLDGRNAANIVGLLRAIAGRGTTVIFATHDQAILRRGGARQIELAEGEIVNDQALGRRWSSG